MNEKNSKIEALKGIAQMMKKLDLDRVKGYKKPPMEEEEPEFGEEEDEDLIKVLDAKAKRV